MDEFGNMNFMVYGYMNRGNHEGEVGIEFYYYNHLQNNTQSMVFCSSTKLTTSSQILNMILVTKYLYHIPVSTLPRKG